MSLCLRDIVLNEHQKVSKNERLPSGKDLTRKATSASSIDYLLNTAVAYFLAEDRSQRNLFIVSSKKFHGQRQTLFYFSYRRFALELLAYWLPISPLLSSTTVYASISLQARVISSNSFHKISCRMFYNSMGSAFKLCCSLSWSSFLEAHQSVSQRKYWPASAWTVPESNQCNSWWRSFRRVRMRRIESRFT